MKKRTKIELIVFAVVAAFYLASLFTGTDKGADSTNIKAVEAAFFESGTETGTTAAQTDQEAYESDAESDDTSWSNEYTWNSDAFSDDEIESIAASGDTSFAGETAAYPGGSMLPGVDYHDDAADTREVQTISEDGSYTDKDSVALYIASYGHLPDNYITKNEAKASGWVSKEGNLAEACPGKSIGGDHFGNYERKLPEKNGRKYFECDINYNSDSGSRGSERIIYSNDGLVYYTGDHYQSFELLYGEP